MEYRWPAPSRAFARAFGRASHEDCCAAARDSTLRYRSCRFRAASPSQPELTELSRAAGSRESGARCVREAAPPPSVPREPDERARIQRARKSERKRREREKERDRLEETVTEEEKEKETERGREGQRRGEKRKRRERTSISSAAFGSACLVSARLCVAIRRTS